MLSIYILFYLVFPLSILCCVKKNRNKTVLLDKDDSVFLKGIATCMVFMAHSQNYLEDMRANLCSGLKPVSVLGGMGVLIFFAVSGYGIYKQYGDSIDFFDFWKKRFIGMYIPYLAIKCPFVVVMCINHQCSNIVDFCINLFLGEWYIDVIMLEYLFFSLSIILANYFPRISIILLQTIFNIGLICIFYVLGFNARWYNGLLLFVVGMLLAEKEKYFICIIKDKIGTYISFFGIMFTICGYIFCLNKGSFLADIFKTIAGCFLTLLFVTLLSVIKCENKCIKWIGSLSLYFYIIHLNILGRFEALRLFGGKIAWMGFWVLAVLTLLLVIVLSSIWNMKKYIVKNLVGYNANI